VLGGVVEGKVRTLRIDLYQPVSLVLDYKMEQREWLELDGGHSQLLLGESGPA
jgi:hypothetical protein